MDIKSTKIVFVGAGNLATNLAIAMHKTGYQIVQVYSRTQQSAYELAQKVGSKFTCDTAQIDASADLYIYALRDEVLCEIIDKIKVTNGLHVHTAGSMPISIFEGNQQNFGVFYPLQSFTKNKIVDFGNIPLFIEANNRQSVDFLQDIANSISNKVFQLSSEERQQLHLAGVFANNFTNHLYSIAAEILAKQNVPFEVLIPMLETSLAKLREKTPHELQTGPAIRGDQKVINKHIEMLANNPDWQDIYKLLTEQIIKHK